MRWVRANPERYRMTSKRCAAKLKLEVLTHYSRGTPQCKCCGVTELIFLTIDHIKEDGSEHRRKLNGKATKMARWLRDNHFPTGFQVLCFNCNFAKHVLGRCPHRKEARHFRARNS